MTTVASPHLASGHDSTGGEMREVRVAMEVVAAGRAVEVVFRTGVRAIEPRRPTTKSMRSAWNRIGGAESGSTGSWLPSSSTRQETRRYRSS
jgi:hypothetical protein